MSTNASTHAAFMMAMQTYVRGSLTDPVLARVAEQQFGTGCKEAAHFRRYANAWRTYGPDCIELIANDDFDTQMHEIWIQPVRARKVSKGLLPHRWPSSWATTEPWLIIVINPADLFAPQTTYKYDAFNVLRTFTSLEDWWESPGDEDMAVRAARIWYDETQGAYAIMTPFDQGFVNWFKATVPKEFRAWEPAQKIWYVHPDKVQAVLDVAKKTFGGCAFIEAPKQQIVRATGGGGNGMRVMELIGYEFMKEAFRKAAFAMHPDRGGDAQKMSELNSLLAQVKSELGWK